MELPCLSNRNIFKAIAEAAHFHPNNGIQPGVETRAFVENFNPSGCIL